MSSVCLSVCLSVTLVDQDHIGWKSWKLIARTISQTPSRFVAQRPSTYRGTWGNGNFGETRGKSGVLEHKSHNISETRKSRGKLLWRTYRNSPTLFRTVQSPTPYGILFFKIGGSQPLPQTQNFNRYYLRNGCSYIRTSNLAGTFRGPIRTKAH